MKIILLILILGIFLLGILGAVSLGIIEVDFTEKVLTISTEKICDAELLSNILEKKCNKDTPKEIDVSQSILSITKNPKTGVIKVQSK